MLQQARPIRSYRARAVSERRLIGEAVVLVAVVRVALSAIPFPLLRRLARPARALVRWLRAPGAPGSDLAASVRIAARHIPDASCLTRALALHLMLLRRGIASKVRIAVDQSEGGFAAHAWLESEGRVLIGGGPGRFTPLHQRRPASLL